MPDDRVVLIILLGLTGILIAMFISWIRRPARVRRWHICVLMAVLIPSYILFLVLRDQQTLSTEDTPGSPIDMSVRQLLVYDNGAGLLFSVRLDGTNKQRVSDAPNGFMPTFVPGSTDLIYPIYDDATESFRLERRALTGEPSAPLTDFSLGREDTDPSVARHTGALYFQRTQYELLDDGTKSLID